MWKSQLIKSGKVPGYPLKSYPHFYSRTSPHIFQHSTSTGQSHCGFGLLTHQYHS